MFEAASPGVVLFPTWQSRSKSSWAVAAILSSHTLISTTTWPLRWKYASAELMSNVAHMRPTRCSTCSPPSDATDYLNICGRLFPNPKYGWRCVDDSFFLMNELDIDYRYSNQDCAPFQAPVDGVRRVLDLQALSGSWGDQVARCYDDADICAINIAPKQAAEQPNCHFDFDDFNLTKWNREPRVFDLTHGQKLLGNIRDRQSLLRNTFHCLAKGGFVELWDRPFIYKGNDGAIGSWNWVAGQAKELGDRNGCSFVVTRDAYKADMKLVGFLDAFEHWELMPVKDCLDSVLNDIECMLLRKWHDEGMDHSDIQEQVEALRLRLLSEASHVSVHCVTV
ncbi:hypothetical protein N657DRAFT_256660 [Parathielavia appendiculata]|uniref:Methyltransferase domain-containing protein n=1 Tax=Parathielavia appendiculata TaxID=2587402 RepID=A0AAN6TSX7_9PEZI|nr:hypothetical protein N657DRAFT_256660 [Parathielavia appendiculata]